MIDSHCHLDHEPMFSDLKNIIKNPTLIRLFNIND